MQARSLALCVAGLALAAAASALPTRAQNYPWCAQYGEDFGDVLNCGFVSFEQCMETIRGMGGFCIVNNRYEPPAKRKPPRAPAKHHARKPS